ncbi:MAG: hypothetical protein ABI861_05115 [Panacibacter sp.]
MKFLYPAIFILGITVNSAAQENNIKSSKEPKSSFELKINGKIYLIKEEEELKLDTILSNPSISIKLSDFKKFDNSHISFQYQRHLSFEYEEDEGYKNWTLSGNNIVVLMFEFDVDVPFSEFIGEMVTKFGKENSSVVDFKKQLGGKDFNGKKLSVSIAGQKLDLDFYEIKLGDNKSRYIEFQNTLDDNNSSSEEYLTVFNKINSTIVFK